MTTATMPVSGPFSGLLPATSCGTCLKIRHQVDRVILAARSTLSDALGLNVGDDVTDRANAGVRTCLEAPQLTGADVVQYREALKLDQAEFAKKFGLPLERLKAMEADEGGVSMEFAKADLVVTDKKLTPDARIIVQIKA